MAPKRRRPNEEESAGSESESEGEYIFYIPEYQSVFTKKFFFFPSGSADGSQYADLNEAALHTIWDVEKAKESLQMISKNPKLTVFAAIRSQWGEGLKVKEAVDAHIEGMYESGYAEPSRGGFDLFGMLEGTRELAEKLQQAKEYEAAFFFAHSVAEMIRRCEKDEMDGEEDEEKVVEWAKGLDTVMAGAVKGWRGKSGKTKKGKQDAATMVELLDKGKRADGCDQKKWYPETFKLLRAWAK